MNIATLLQQRNQSQKTETIESHFFGRKKRTGVFQQSLPRQLD